MQCRLRVANIFDSDTAGVYVSRPFSGLQNTLCFFLSFVIHFSFFFGVFFFPDLRIDFCFYDSRSQRFTASLLKRLGQLSALQTLSSSHVVRVLLFLSLLLGVAQLRGEKNIRALCVLFVSKKKKPWFI